MAGVVPARDAGEPATRPGATTRRAALRVALASDWFLPRRGGVELQLAGLADRLAAAGHRVDVLTPTPGAPGVDAEPGVVRLDVPRFPGLGVAYTPALLGALGRALDRGAYDVVHAHASVVSPAAFAAVALARRRGVPCVVTFHSVLDRPLRLAGAAALRRWTRDPGVVLAGVSTLVATQLRGMLPGAPVGVLPNGCDLAWWRAGDRAAAGRAVGDGGGPARPAGLAAPGGELRVVTAMRLVGKKRPLALLPVAAALRAAAPAGTRVRLLVAGEGRERTRLERAARRAGLADVVAVLGWQSRAELRALYCTADAFVLPTVRESFGIAALEARAAGLPVLARAGTGIADFVAPGAGGWLAASDADLIAQAAAWARDPAALAAARRESAAAPPAAFGWDAVTGAHLDAYAAAGARTNGPDWGG